MPFLTMNKAGLGITRTRSYMLRGSVWDYFTLSDTSQKHVDLIEKYRHISWTCRQKVHMMRTCR